MFTWKKLGRVFDPTTVKGKRWLKEFAQAPSAVIFDTFVRVYFSCRPPRDKDGQYVSYTAYVDLDRNNLLNIVGLAGKPIFELGGLGTFDEFGTYPTSVIRHDKELIAYFGGWTRCESVPWNVAVGMAKSTDGKTFTKMGPGPVLSSSLDEPFIISGPKIRRFNNRWCLWYIAGKKWIVDNGRPEAVFKIRVAFSDNGIDWVKEGKDLIENKLDENEVQASPDVFFYKGKYHMFFCYKYSTDFRKNKRGYRIGYAYSDDMISWTRDDTRAGIDISQKGWDSESIAYPHVLELDGSLYLFYIGNEVGKFGFGLAKLETYSF